MQRPKNEMLLELCGAGDHQSYADGAQGSSELYLGCTQRSSEPSTAISGDHVVSVGIEPACICKTHALIPVLSLQSLRLLFLCVCFAPRGAQG